MSKITADRRSREIDPNPESVRLAAESADRLLAEMRVLAGRLAAVSAGGGHLALGFSSVWDFARQHLRIPGAVVGLVLNLSRALEVEASHVTAAEAGQDDPSEAGPETEEAAGDAAVEAGSGAGDGAAVELETAGSASVPSVEDRVAGKAMSTENAAVLGRLFRQVGGISTEERAKWTKLAEDEPPWKLRQLVRKRIEEAAQREPTVPMAFAVTESSRDAFRRARDLASRQAGRRLTEGQTFALVVRRFVRDEDERLVGEKKRRVPDTRRRPESRYVPAKVRRAVKRRARDRCEVPGCSNGAFLDLMHVGEAHCDGGSRELDNLAYGCTAHHFLLDAGVIRFGGWRDGRPVFLDAWRREIREVPRESESRRRGGDARSASASARAGGVDASGAPARDSGPDDARVGELESRGVEPREWVAPRQSDATTDSRGDSPPPATESMASQPEGASGTEPIERRTSQTDAWPRDSEPGSGQVAERPPPWECPGDRRVVGGRDSTGSAGVGRVLREVRRVPPEVVSRRDRLRRCRRCTRRLVAVEAVCAVAEARRAAPRASARTHRDSLSERWGAPPARCARPEATVIASGTSGGALVGACGGERSPAPVSRSFAVRDREVGGGRVAFERSRPARRGRVPRGGPTR